MYDLCMSFGLKILQRSVWKIMKEERLIHIYYMRPTQFLYTLYY